MPERAQFSLISKTWQLASLSPVAPNDMWMKNVDETNMKKTNNVFVSKLLCICFFFDKLEDN